MKKFILITTGGTIEKSYNEEKGVLHNHGSVLRFMLAQLRLPDVKIKHIDLLAKDSLLMDAADRELILKTIQKNTKNGSAIIILHGTDTMALTAQYLYESLPKRTIPILLTGAMKPFGIVGSDAQQNFTETLLAASLVKSGIYIVFHNKVLPLPNVRKNKRKLSFEKIISKPSALNKKRKNVHKSR